MDSWTASVSTLRSVSTVLGSQQVCSYDYRRNTLSNTRSTGLLMTALVWYRNDLRVADHTPLAAALRSGQPVRAAYLLCPGQWDKHDVAPLRRWYVLESVRELGETLAARGVALDVIDCGDFAAAPEALARLARRHAVGALYYTYEYPLNELNRDRAVDERLSALGVVLHGFDDSVLLPPSALYTGQGRPYSIFTPYYKRWQARLREEPPQPQSLPAATQAVQFPGRVSVDDALHEFKTCERQRGLWPPGERAAQARLAEFVDEGGLTAYHRQRDIPALDGTSRLSAALSAGTLSPARCYLRAQEQIGQASSVEGAQTWLSELAWRDFYRQIMANFPRLAKGEPFRAEGAYLQWSDNKENFQAWCEGRTGYPLVDAAMRQLNSIGWMHNRLRMLVAVFLSKHLFIDWRWGERYFMTQLIDGDFAANNGGWQWSASTGTDAVPYFRVFSPVRQSERFDAEGSFIRRYVPELADCPAPAIRRPWQHAAATRYPQPIVEHSAVRARVTAAFKRAKRRAESG